jgi:alpha-tubulin suppressor-like RCC1 family protein
MTYSMRTLPLLTLALALTLAACGKDDDSCATNADCFSGEVCNQTSRLCGPPMADMGMPDMTPADMGQADQADQADQAQGPLAAPGELVVAPSARGTLTLSWAPVPGARRYQVKIVEAGQDWQDSDIAPGWEDLAPPPVTVHIDMVSASQGVHFTHVALDAQASASAATRGYQVRALDAGGMPGASAQTEGALPVPAQLDYAWEVARQPGAFAALAGATDASFEDLEAAEGGTHYTYRARVSAPGLTPTVSEPVEGWRKRPKVVQLDAGGRLTCALLETGVVRCWGGGPLLGYGVNTLVLHDPSANGDVPLGGLVKQISVNNVHACALMESGKIRCWGWNLSDALTDLMRMFARGDTRGDAPGEMPPPDVPLPEEAIAVSTGSSYTCAIGASQAIYCWGSNASGSLGTPSLPAGVQQPTKVVFKTTTPPVTTGPLLAERITLFGSHACATGTQDGLRSNYCWGLNDHGQLGSGDTVNHGAPGTDGPKRIATPGEMTRNPIMISVGGSHTCGQMPTDELRCWGDGRAGRLGTPRPAEPMNPSSPTDSLNISGTNAIVRLLANGVNQVDDLSSGSDHTCAITRSDRKVRCWGSGVSGKLGTGSVEAWGDDVAEIMIPFPAVELGQGAVAVSSGSEHTCALLADGEIRCWGDNSLGQLGLDPNTVTKLGDTMTALPNDPKYNVPLLKK